MERINDDGTWESPDGGRTWLLTRPAQAWRDARAADPDPEPLVSTEERLAQLEQELATVRATAEPAKATADEVARRPR